VQLRTTGVVLTTCSRRRLVIKIPGGALSQCNRKHAIAVLELRTTGGALTTCRGRAPQPNVAGEAPATRSHSLLAVSGQETRQVRSW